MSVRRGLMEEHAVSCVIAGLGDQLAKAHDPGSELRLVLASILRVIELGL